MMMKTFLVSSLCALSIATNATEYTITSTNDSGAGTLREALSMNESGDIITFQSSLSGTITLASDLPPVQFDTLINGPSSLAVTINGANAYQMFDVSANAYVTVTNLVLEDVKTSTAGGAFLLGEGGVLTLDTVTVPHCESSCEAPIFVSETAAILANDVTFSNPGNGGVDIVLEQDSGAMLSCSNSVQPQIWLETTGSSVIYKEGPGTLDLKASSSIDTLLVADEGTLLFSDTALQPIYALSSGTLVGTSTSFYVGNIGLVKTGDGGFGTINNTQDYYQDSTGNLIVKIDAAANTDLVHALEVGHLAGSLIIQLAPGEYTASTAYTLVTCDEGFTAPFDNAYFDIPGMGLQTIMNANLSYTADSVVLTITSNFTVQEPMGFASMAAAAKPALSPPASPVNKLYKWMLSHKKKPKQNVLKTMTDYTKQLAKDIKKK